MTDNLPVERLITLRRCLLALALAFVQLVVPVSGYTQMAHDGVLLQDICSASGAGQVPRGTDGDGQVLVAGHAQHCAFCGTSPAILPPVSLADFAQQVPQDVIRVGGLRHQLGAIAHRPPATGPPGCA